LRADERHLERPRRPGAQVRELLGTHAAPPSEPLHDDGPPELELLARLVVKRDRPPAQLVESVERLDQVAEERVAPLLAVGDHVESGGLLQAHRAVDGVILGALVGGRGESTGFETLSRLDQRRWAQ
jgi:hypothetical protein